MLKGTREPQEAPPGAGNHVPDGIEGQAFEPGEQVAGEDVEPEPSGVKALVKADVFSVTIAEIRADPGPHQ